MMTTFFIVSFLLIFCCQVLESSPTIGVVGGEVNINITISDRSIDTGRELRDPNGVILLFFTPKAVNAAYIDPNVTYTGNIPGGFVSFTLSKLTIQSAGIYQYIISKGVTGNVIAGEHNLIIAGMPNTPVITALSQQAVAGRDYKLNCNAVSTSKKPGHNLTMFSEWKRNGTNIRADDSKYGFNETILTIRNLSRTDDNVSIMCIAFEDQRVKSLDSTAFPLNVYYGPDIITLTPSQMSYDLVENFYLNINCSADCVPSCQYRWTGPDVNYPDTTGILSISKISRSHAGLFTCTAFNSNITSNSATATVSVTVQYGPDNIKLSTSQISYEVVENSSFNVNCSADCVPSCQYRWTGPGVNYTDKTGILSISKISRNHAGVYTCMATNPSITSNSATATVLVTVQYPPSIQGLTSPYKVIENLPLNVTCVVNSNPPANLIFWYPRGEGSVNSILYFSSVLRNKSGIYNCTAQNTMTPTVGKQQNGTTTIQIQVDVLYGARISNLSVHGGNTIDENSSAIFNCHVDSNPPSNITWMKEGSSDVLKTESGVVQSNYTIKSAECLENYTCSADNGIWTTAKERLELFVRCHPRTDFRLGLETKLYRKHHGEAILRYTVISYPPPTFTWIFLGNGNESRALPVSASHHDNGQQSELRITNLGITDFGNYSVIANNSLFPSTMVVFEIIQADVPEVPSYIEINEITQTSVKVQWMAGYNGGPQQTFHIVASADSSTHNITADDPGYQQTGTAVLNGLLPGTKYSIYVVAINLFGPSNITQAINITTLEIFIHS